MQDINSFNLNNNITIKENNLSNTGDLKEEQYQLLWSNSNNNIISNRTKKISAEEIETDGFIKYLEENKIFVKAFGGNLRMFIYSRLTNNSAIYLLAELVFNFQDSILTYTVKSTDTGNSNLSNNYEEYLLRILEPLL